MSCLCLHQGDVREIRLALNRWCQTVTQCVVLFSLYMQTPAMFMNVWMSLMCIGCTALLLVVAGCNRGTLHLFSSSSTLPSVSRLRCFIKSVSFSLDLPPFALSSYFALFFSWHFSTSSLPPCHLSASSPSSTFPRCTAVRHGSESYRAGQSKFSLKGSLFKAVGKQLPWSRTWGETEHRQQGTNLLTVLLGPD